MIRIITGLPGAGKTLFALWYVQREFRGREVYYDGIEGLRLPWSELEGGGKEWAGVPDGSVVVIDEAQRIFRTRGVGAVVPAHVQGLETHRHRGIDLVLITQHPKLIDTHVRRLCGEHFHVVRAFGVTASVVHRWGELVDDPDKSRADSLRTNFEFPRELYDVYKSAEVHTHKRKIPWRVYSVIALPVVAIGLMAYGGWLFVDRYAQEKGLNVGKPAVAGDVRAPVFQPDKDRAAGTSRKLEVASWNARQAQFIEAHRPFLPGLAYTAERYAQVTEVRQAPEPAACVSSSTRCTCYTQQATLLSDVGSELCQQIVAHGYFRAWQEPGAQVTVVEKPAAVVSSEAVALRHADADSSAGAAPVAAAQAVPQRVARPPAQLPSRTALQSKAAPR